MPTSPFTSSVASSPPVPAESAPSSAPSANGAKRILLVDDHPGFRRGLNALLTGEEEFEVCGEASTSPMALEAMRNLKPDFAILDISLPGTNGIELIKLMLAEQPKLRILMLSMHDESTYALRALRAGAKGYVMKAEALESVLAALRKIEAGGIYISPVFNDRLVFKAIQSDIPDDDSPVDSLSDRELEVLELLGKGFGTREVAESLHLSVKTVETHRSHIKEKLGFMDSRELVRFAIEWCTREGREGKEDR